MSAGAPGTAGADWFSPRRFAWLLALLIFAAFPQVLLGLQTFVVRDYGFFAYPLAHFQREAFWHGEIPLWNPLNDCGIPFLAQWNTMPLYPPALIYLLLPLTWSLSFFCLLHLWFAGFGAYFLARRWTGCNFAAAFAGVAFAFNGFTLNLLMWPSHIATFAWMPWVVLLAERAWREGGKMIFLAALAGAMQMLGGGPETILFTWLLLAALWLANLFRDEPPRVKAAGRLPAVVILVAALAAAQLLPFLDLAAHSQRDTGYADSRWALPLRGWANFFVPMAFGRIWNMGVFFQHDQAWTSSYYLGMAATLLALFALWRVRDRRVWLLGGAAALALLFALGDQFVIVRALRHAVPQLALMTYPVKFLIVVALLVPQLAAFGLARLRSNEPRPIPVVVGLGAVTLLLIAGILFWAWKFPLPGDDPRATLLNGLARVGFLTASVLLLLTLARPNARFRFAPITLLLVAWLDVFNHEPTQNPTVAPWIYEPGLARAKLELQPQPALGESRALVSPLADLRFTQVTTRQPADNLIAKRLGLFANCNLLDDVPKVNGFFSLYPRAIGELMSALYGATNHTATAMLDFLGVSQMSAPEHFSEWRARTNWLPFLDVGRLPAFVADTNALRVLLLSDFDPRKNILLPAEVRGRISVTNATTARFLGWHVERERIACEVEVADAALVSVAQTYYHRWRAFVDDQPATLLRANFAFQAVDIPSGRHRVRLEYVDRAFHLGVAISLAALAVCLGGLGLAWRKHD